MNNFVLQPYVRSLPASPLDPEKRKKWSDFKTAMKEHDIILEPFQAKEIVWRALLSRQMDVLPFLLENSSWSTDQTFQLLNNITEKFFASIDREEAHDWINVLETVFGNGLYPQGESRVVSPLSHVVERSEKGTVVETAVVQQYAELLYYAGADTSEAHRRTQSFATNSPLKVWLESMHAEQEKGVLMHEISCPVDFFVPKKKI